MRLAALLLASSFALPAQPPAAQVAEMKKLSFLEGNWKGSGWIQQGPGKRQTFRQTEDVRFRLDGLVVEIEGLGLNDAGAVVHHALALISSDAETGALHFRSHDGHGRYLDAEASLKEGVFEWGFTIPAGRTRYLIRLNEKGQWHETGEFCRDARTCYPVFEMTLDRSK